MSELIAVIESHAYLSKASRFTADDERSAVVDALAQDPLSGVIIRGTGGLRKARFASSGRGKRGGGRVIYWYRSRENPIVLLWAFAKNEASDLSHEQLKRLMAVAAILDEELEGGDERRRFRGPAAGT